MPNCAACLATIRALNVMQHVDGRWLKQNLPLVKTYVSLIKKTRMWSHCLIDVPSTLTAVVMGFGEVNSR